ncbi:MAG: hypothetical protein COA78_30280 [Blastopirellula sp.]|nr:MAG: hypothetical protein COA78_30280 [Blastopirellula sp.]
MNKYLRILIGISLAVPTALASLYLSRLSMDSLFGLGSFLVVPVIAVALVFTLVSCDPSRRIWWFGFTVVAGLWLHLCPLIESGVHGIANHLQDLTQAGKISLSQRIIEPSSLILNVMLPLIGVILTGMLAGYLAQRMRMRYVTSAEESNSYRWQISMRELFVGTCALCIFIAMFMNRTRDWQTGESQNQQQFLTKFESSFNQDQFELIGPIHIQEQQRSIISKIGFRSFKPPGVNEYRVTAQIKKDGTPHWGVWAYTCNGAHNDMIYKFAYAEAATEEELAALPSPPQVYIDATWKLEDGVPK